MSKNLQDSTKTLRIDLFLVKSPLLLWATLFALGSGGVSAKSVKAWGPRAGAGTCKTTRKPAEGRRGTTDRGQWRACPGPDREELHAAKFSLFKRTD